MSEAMSFLGKLKITDPFGARLFRIGVKGQKCESFMF
jgi:hypothetical protein